MEDARRAVTAKERFHGPDSAEAGMSLSNFALYLSLLGDLEAAIPAMQRGINAVEAGFGADHPRTAGLLSNYGEVLNKVGRYEEAREMARRALAIFEREAATNGLVLSYPLTALGVGYLGDGLVDQALPVLERAVTIRDAKEKRAANLGEVHFALARALRVADRDLPRARALALAARAEYASDTPNDVHRRCIAEIDAWLGADTSARAAEPPAHAEPATAVSAPDGARPS
jgi:tetratricopeptide (TPR) repeat protein